MEANEFVTRLKANGSANDISDLEMVIADFKKISSNLSAKDKGSFAVNVLCILCRNLDKVPSWSQNVSCKDLVTLSVECVRDTRSLGPSDRVKVLVCIYHIHRYAIRQNTSIPPELLLKLSYMPFETDTKCMLSEYVKTYWNIMADRISYIERLKTEKLAIIKLLSKTTEHLVKIIDLYDTVQFTNNILTLLVKKLFFLYHDYYAKNLNETFKAIFQALNAKKDLKSFKTLPEKDIFALYSKFNEAFYVIVENSSKTNFKASILKDVVRTFLSFVGHRADIFHCVQTFHLNSFCSLLTEKSNYIFNESILNNLLQSCETTDKLGYKNAMICTYPYIYQLLRLYIEYCVTNSDSLSWEKIFNIESQEVCLKLILVLMRKMRCLEQLLKCENCVTKTGLHDSLRLSFSAKHFITLSVNKAMDIKYILPVYFSLIQEQYNVMKELSKLGCVNYIKFFKKAQTDIHNSAILLNKAGYYEYSINTFNIYLKNEIKQCFNEADKKNISRGFYNKSICELDFQLYDNALQSAYLSLLFAQPVGLNSEKYISLVIDIKAKIIKIKSSESVEENEITAQDKFQFITVLDACRMAMENNHFGDLSRFFDDLNFSQLLRHEFTMYSKLWPSVVPVAGVWTALLKISEDDTIKLPNRKNEAINTLFEVILETATVVRTIHNEYFKKIIRQLTANFRSNTANEKLFLAAILFLNCEYDLADASERYGWKGIETPEPEMVTTRTFEQEHKALANGVKAVEIMNEVLPDIKKLPPSRCLPHALSIAEMFVPQLLLLDRPAHALQLALICSDIADLVDDRESYVRNAGAILYHARDMNPLTVSLCKVGGQRATELMRSDGAVDTALGFFCDAAIFYMRTGMKAAAGDLVQYVQAAILEASENGSNVNLEMATGRLLEAQAIVFEDTAEPTLLTAAFGIQRHYATITNHYQKYTHRRTRAWWQRARAAAAGALASGAARRLLLWRRRAAPARPRVLALCTHDTLHAQVVIDNYLKFSLGLPTNESLTSTASEHANKQTHTYTPKRELLEPMRDSLMYKRTETSPTLPRLIVPGFNMPEFYTHLADCKCYACETPCCLVLACQTAGLEASVHFRAKETNIAKNYYNGVLRIFGHVETKLADVKKRYESMNFNRYVVEIVDSIYRNNFKHAQIDILIEASFFELSQCNYEKADDYVVRIHEIMQEIEQSGHLRGEVYNLMCASAQLRKATKPTSDQPTGLEKELENLKLSPVTDKPLNPPKTPEQKVPVPQLPKILVDNDELPNAKRKVIKLNLDDVVDVQEEVTKPIKRTSRRAEFKIPVPITNRAVQEVITPRPTKNKPLLLLTQPSLDSNNDIYQTPTHSDTRNEFFTPNETPEQFFTPITSVKTYSKSKLRDNIVKNLEQEFTTAEPSNSDKENTRRAPQKSLLAVPKKSKVKVETGSMKTLREKRAELKRATSPGKLKDEKKLSPGKARRQLRRPVKLSLDGDEKLPK